MATFCCENSSEILSADTRAQGPSLIDADLTDFNQVDVRREWRDIDILIDFPHDGISENFVPRRTSSSGRG
ncbi:hypothetical protein NLM31_08500 [Bradyrhizobium sp. CCGUVB4N]|uniref:hypothetical protein n=1 Tax=Bradyrhizobium sp. CCGUVB4N TaxID=2949631 RepID=UPI0020B4341D|nr:hypothetical protein [Bradyrhizobium sp. CCGUVB4N]MCP3380408.1 hypothetical protein [Bradyrhizobium sp. CCGUVB4N]